MEKYRRARHLFPHLSFMLENRQIEFAVEGLWAGLPYQFALPNENLRPKQLHVVVVLFV